jgi:hypothetical protein
LISEWSTPDHLMLDINDKNALDYFKKSRL